MANTSNTVIASVAAQRKAIADAAIKARAKQAKAEADQRKYVGISAAAGDHWSISRSNQMN